MQDIGKRIRQARLAKGLVQRELAALVTVHQATIAHWESNDETRRHLPRKKLIANLARALNVSPEWLEFGLMEYAPKQLIDADILHQNAFKEDTPPPQSSNFMSGTLVDTNDGQFVGEHVVALANELLGRIDKSTHLPPIPNSLDPQSRSAEHVNAEITQTRSQSNQLNRFLALFGLQAATLAFHYINGDAMEPTLASGDWVLIDTSDISVTPKGLFIINDSSETFAARIDGPDTSNISTLELKFDNFRCPDREVGISDIKILGRIVWRGTRL